MYTYFVIISFRTKATGCVVTPVLSGHSKIDKTKILMTNGEGRKYCRMLPLEHSAILLTCILKKHFLVFLRVSVLDRFYFTYIR